MVMDSRYSEFDPIEDTERKEMNKMITRRCTSYSEFDPIEDTERGPGGRRARREAASYSEFDPIEDTERPREPSPAAPPSRLQ